MQNQETEAEPKELELSGSVQMSQHSYVFL